ncbi:MAG TPA: hypothetical protein VIV60_37640, partial [Polyangiaceae bacterium]
MISRLASPIDQFRHVVSGRTGLQQVDEFNPQHAIEALPCFKGHAKKFHSELLALDPFDRAEFNGQRRRLIREQDT